MGPAKYYPGMLLLSESMISRDLPCPTCMTIVVPYGGAYWAFSEVFFFNFLYIFAIVYLIFYLSILIFITVNYVFHFFFFLFSKPYIIGITNK